MTSLVFQARLPIKIIIEKKNPLVMPPEFQVLPEPKNIKSKKAADKDFNINKILENANKIKNLKEKKIQENHYNEVGQY